MSTLLETIRDPAHPRGMSLPQLEQLAGEIREVLCGLIACRMLTSRRISASSNPRSRCTSGVRLQERPADLGYGPPDLSPQVADGALCGISVDVRMKGGLSYGLPQPVRERLRPVHDRSRRGERLHRPRPGERRRILAAGREPPHGRGDRRRRPSPFRASCSRPSTTAVARARSCSSF